jgi:hypothetical protein
MYPSLFESKCALAVHLGVFLLVYLAYTNIDNHGYNSILLQIVSLLLESGLEVNVRNYSGQVCSILDFVIHFLLLPFLVELRIQDIGTLSDHFLFMRGIELEIVNIVILIRFRRHHWYRGAY